jgi:hypothetical protein
MPVPAAGPESVLTSRRQTGHLPAETARTSTLTSFEGTSDIERMIIGRVVAGLEVR